MEQLQVPQIVQLNWDQCFSHAGSYKWISSKRTTHPSDPREAKVPSSHPTLAKYSDVYFISFKNLVKGHDLPVTVQTLVSRLVSGYLFLFPINKTVSLGLEDLSHSPALLLNTWHWENHNTSLNYFFTFEELGFASAVLDIYCGYETIMCNSAITYN